MDVRFKTPANFYISGQTQAGKSHFTRHMLRHLEELFYPVPTKIIYCYGECQKKFDELPPNVELMEGFPDNVNDMVRGHDHSLVVLDDLMAQCSNDQRVADLFTRGSHHRGISVLYLTQNLFPPGKLSRTISLNSHYCDFSKSARLVGYFNAGETNVPWTYRLPHGIVSRRHEQTLRIFGDRLPSTDTRKRAVENEHIARRETDCVRETYLNRARRRDRSLSRCRSV